MKARGEKLLSSWVERLPAWTEEGRLSKRKGSVSDFFVRVCRKMMICSYSENGDLQGIHS